MTTCLLCDTLIIPKYSDFQLKAIIANRIKINGCQKGKVPNLVTRGFDCFFDNWLLGEFHVSICMSYIKCKKPGSRGFVD